MGKPTGFMEYQRLAEVYEPAGSRLKHYREFVVTLDDEKASLCRLGYLTGETCLDLCRRGVLSGGLCNATP